MEIQGRIDCDRFHHISYKQKWAQSISKGRNCGTNCVLKQNKENKLRFGANYKNERCFSHRKRVKDEANSRIRFLVKCYFSNNFFHRNHIFGQTAFCFPPLHVCTTTYSSNYAKTHRWREYISSENFAFGELDFDWCFDSLERRQISRSVATYQEKYIPNFLF